MTDKPIGGCGFDEHCAETTIVVHGRSGREHVVVKLFSGRAAKLEAMNRILTDSARQRAERVEELERKIEILEPQLLEARQRLKILRNVEDAATERAARIQELENELRELRIEYAKKDVPRVEAEREFYRKRMNELEEHSHQLTEAVTRHAKRVNELQEHNQQLTEAVIKHATRVNEVEEHNQQLTEAAVKYASRAQELERELSELQAQQADSKDTKRLPLS
jgi:chromosome segregation ATPase